MNLVIFTQSTRGAWFSLAFDNKRVAICNLRVVNVNVSSSAQLNSIQMFKCDQIIHKKEGVFFHNHVAVFKPWAKSSHVHTNDRLETVEEKDEQNRDARLNKQRSDRCWARVSAQQKLASKHSREQLGTSRLANSCRAGKQQPVASTH